jgi:alkylation response protein AidB-like acyl-CoA dehydrogenase
MNDIDPVEEVRAWLADNWDPDLTVAEWWALLGGAGWAAPSLPTNAYGRGLSRADSVRISKAVADFGALGAPAGLGLLLAAPTIAAYGTQEQIDRFVEPIVTGRHAWCQLFSEPGAGSDLAGLQCKAERDGDQWVITGQKVWTSGGRVADMGMLVARTDLDLPKHQGITYFALDMRQPGAVEVRPLREMTGRALFNEVFITEAVVDDDARIGGLNNGWAVANATLAFERAGLGAGGGHDAAVVAQSGSIAGDLGKRAGDFVRVNKADASGMAVIGSAFGKLCQAARDFGVNEDPVLRQDLVRIYELGELGRLGALRAKGAAQAGNGEIPGLNNIAKLSMSATARLGRDVGMRILGASGMLHAYDKATAADLDEITGRPGDREITEMALVSPGPAIYGGSDQIQRNIIGERVLGLPKEPGPSKHTPFRDLPKNG